MIWRSRLLSDKDLITNSGHYIIPSFFCNFSLLILFLIFSDKKDGLILGLRLLDNRLVVIGVRGWAVLDMTGKMINIVTVPRPRHDQQVEDPVSGAIVMNQDPGLVHSVRMLGLDTAGVITWLGLESSNMMTLQTIRGGAYTDNINNFL